ncbi:MAG TPA: hypothetical protein PLI16_10490 [Bacteroidales bacterium]|nr:hypothetical protein [Bacteroidales bacterium]
MQRNFMVSIVLLGCIILFSSYRIIPVKTVSPDKSDSTFLITDGKVGKVEINMDVNKLKNIFPESQMKEKKVDSEGDEYALYMILEPDNKTLAMEIESLCADICLVSRINILLPKYKTMEGVGVGSPFAEIKKNYTMKNIVGGEDNSFMVYVKEYRDIAFIVKSAEKKPKFGKPYEASEILGTDVVKQIFIF